MTFRGFLLESKKYMSYEGMNIKERIRFWFRYPFAWIKFMYYGNRGN